MRMNPSVDRVQPYKGGRPIDEIAREYGVADIIKLASNESPTEPFPEVIAAIAAAAVDVNRYPDGNCFHLTKDVAKAMDLPEESLWFGAGSSELLGCIATSLGGSGTTAVFAWPSFALYPVLTMRGGAEPTMVPVGDDQGHDLEAMGSAIDADTSVVYLCNPNNPTGTHLSAGAIEAFITSVPEDVLVVVDEAYAEFVTAADFGTMLPLALRRPNVIVLRTFSKIYGLAGLRVGYGVAQPETISHLRRSQRPFTVSDLAQVAAREAIRYPGRVEERRRENDRGRLLLGAGLAERGLTTVASQANFVFTDFGPDAARMTEDLLHRGVIIRPFDGGWARVTVGSEYENRRFLMALDQVL